MSENITAEERNKAADDLRERNEKYKACPQRTFVHEYGGCTYRVHCHFIGDKDLDEVLSRLAFEQALRDNHLSA